MCKQEKKKEKKKKTCEEILACEDLSIVAGVPLLYEMQHQTRDCLEVCRGSDHATNPLLLCTVH